MKNPQRICHYCHRRVPRVIKGLCRSCAQQLGHYRREQGRQESRWWRKCW